MAVCKTTRCRVTTNIGNDGYCHKCVKKQEELANDNVPYPCGKCSKNCDDDSSGLMCELCLSWYHIICVDIARDAYDVLRKMPAYDGFALCAIQKLIKL